MKDSPPDEFDVFVSYRHKDAEAVKRLVKELRTEGLAVWIDKNKIQDFEGITKSIRDGLSKSKALLAYYSSVYPLSRACQWELTAAILAARHERSVHNRILVINPEKGASHIHPTILRDQLFLKDPVDGTDYSVTQLASRIRRHVNTLKGRLGEILPLTPPRWFPSMGTGSVRFVGRFRELWDIDSALHASETAVTSGTSSPGVALVNGLGGTGKTLLSEEYGLRFGAAFPGGVFVINAFGNDDAKAGLNADEREAERTRQIRDFAVGFGLPIKDRKPEEIEAHVTAEFERRNLPFLWIVDDVPSGMDGAALRKWLSPHPLGKTLITTRSREHDYLKMIALDVLEPEEAYQLVTMRREPRDKAEEDAARAIATDDLGGHALALDVAGAYLHKTAGLITFARFRDDLKNPSNDDLELAKEFTGVLPTGHERSIAATLLRSINDLGEEGLDFLRLASVLAQALIPPRLVAAVFSDVGGLNVQEGERRALIGIAQADILSLVEADKTTDSRSVHTLVSRTIRFRDSSPSRINQLRTTVVNILRSILEPCDDRRTHAILEPYVIHARHLIADSRSIEVAKLMERVARFDFVQGDFRTAAILNRRHLDINVSLLGKEHPDTLISMNNLATTLHALGDLTGARGLIDNAFDINKKIFGEEHPATITNMHNLSGILLAQGDLAGARMLGEKALKIKKRVFGELHPATLKSMSRLAEIRHKHGDLVGARELQENVVAIRKQVLGEDHPDTLESMSNQANTLCALGDLTKALVLQERVLEISKRVFGDEHLDTLINMSNLATTLQARGDLASARKLQEKVLEISKQALGEEHPFVLDNMDNLAGTLRAQGELARARELVEAAREIYKRKLGDEHPDTLTNMNNLAVILQEQGDLAGARSIQEKVLEIRKRVLEETHPATLRSMNSLAVILQAQGDLSGAQNIQEQVLKINKRFFGDEHSDTTIVAWNLLNTLIMINDIANARKVYKDQLAWLFKKPTEELSADQKRITEKIAKLRDFFE